MAIEESLMQTAPVKIGYGFNRREATLRDAGAERVYLDQHETRPQLRFLLDHLDMALRPGDVLLVAAPGDLGRNRKAVAKALADAGVLCQVRGHEPVLCSNDERRRAFLAQADRGADRVEPEKGGRPRKFAPTPEQDAAIRELWFSPARRSYVIERASEITGQAVKDYWLRDKYGPRGGATKGAPD